METILKIRSVIWVTPIRTIQRYLKLKTDKLLVLFFEWALSKRSVQQVIADTFDGSTPMCRVIARAIEGADQQEIIEVDNILGFDRAVEGAIEDALDDVKIKASQIEDFNQEIEQAIRDNSDYIVNEVISEMSNRLSR